MKSLNIFYEEPEDDRWFPFDRYLRRGVRRIVRGKPKPSGHERVFLNLIKGLTKLKITFRINDFKYTKQHPDEVACIVGKPQVLDRTDWKNPIIFGAAVFSHPVDQPNLLELHPSIKRILVPGEWMRCMWEPYFGPKVSAWPVGIDTDLWSENSDSPKEVNFLLYDKVRWQHDAYEEDLLAPIREILRKRQYSFCEVRYGCYREEDYHELIKKCQAMIFVCEHETQGIAYQQALSSGVPILAWDRGGVWQDPAYYPDRVQFSPVTSVPYWNDRCGMKFNGIAEFRVRLDEFVERLRKHEFAPRKYVLENLTLEKCAADYVKIWEATAKGES